MFDDFDWLEWSLVLVLIGVVVVVCVALFGGSPAQPQPPVMNAPLLDIVRYCESNARETYTTTSMSPSKIGNTLVMVPQTITHIKDAPEKFVACMQTYEYTVKR